MSTSERLGNKRAINARLQLHQINNHNTYHSFTYIIKMIIVLILGTIFLSTTLLDH